MFTGKELKILRNRLGLPLKDIAKVMCTTKQTISNIELGGSNNQCTLKFYNLVLLNMIDDNLDEKVEEMRRTL